MSTFKYSKTATVKQFPVYTQPPVWGVTEFLGQPTLTTQPTIKQVHLHQQSVFVDGKLLTNVAPKSNNQPIDKECALDNLRRLTPFSYKAADGQTYLGIDPAELAAYYPDCVKSDKYIAYLEMIPLLVAAIGAIND